MIGRSPPGESTVKPVNGEDVPASVVTVRLRVSVVALVVMVMVTGRPVAVAPVPMMAVTPVPLKSALIAPVRSEPVMRACTVVPVFPEDGVMPVIEGRIAAGGNTVNPVKDADVPAAVVTVKLRTSVVALVVMAMVTGRPVTVPPVPMIAVTPVPLKSILVAPVRSAPLII